MRSINLRSSVIASMLLVLAVFLCQCTQAQKKSDYPVVSPVAIQPGKPLQQVPLLPRLDISYGEGDCAPRFENGMRGTCINGKPCNGFGFKDADGRIQCACFEKLGGCEANQGCSLQRRACVAQREIDRISPARQR